MSVIICPSCKLAFDCFDPIIPVFQILPLKYHTHIVFLTAIPSNTNSMSQIKEMLVAFYRFLRIFGIAAIMFLPKVFEV